MLPLYSRLHTNLLFGCVKLIYDNGYMGFAVNVVSSNPCVGPSTRIRLSSSLLWIWTDRLISAPNIVAFFPKLPSVDKNSERESNLML